VLLVAASEEEGKTIEPCVRAAIDGAPEPQGPMEEEPLVACMVPAGTTDANAGMLEHPGLPPVLLGARVTPGQLVTALGHAHAAQCVVMVDGRPCSGNCSETHDPHVTLVTVGASTDPGSPNEDQDPEPAVWTGWTAWVRMMSCGLL
jgi:hypothetical protein